LRIDALRAGDTIVTATKHGAVTTDTVSLLSIAKPEAQATFVTLVTDAGQTLTLTPEHHVPVGEVCCTNLQKAKDVDVGQAVWAVSAALAPMDAPVHSATLHTVDAPVHSATLHTVATKSHVASKHYTIEHGLHSPVMTHGSFPVVNGVVTSFDSIEGVTLAELGLTYLEHLLKATGTASLGRHLLSPSSSVYIDAYAFRTPARELGSTGALHVSDLLTGGPSAAEI